MFSLASKIVIFSSTVLGFGGLGLFGGNELSKTTISDSLGEVKPVSESYEKKDGIWSDLLTYFLHNQDKSKSKKFRDLFPSLGSGENLPQNAEGLREKGLEKLCKESYGELYSSLLGKNNDDLKSDVKDFCSIQVVYITSISNKLLDFSQGSYKDQDKTSWVKNLNSLKSSGDVNSELDSGLSSIKQSIQTKTNFNDDSESINSLFNWCKDKVNSYYVGKEVNKISLIEKYCVRDSTNIRQ